MQFISKDTITNSRNNGYIQTLRRTDGQQPPPSPARLTGVPQDAVPGLLGDYVEQQGGDEGREGPQPHRAVSAAAGHGERAAGVAS